MATQPDGKSDNPGSEGSKPVDANSQNDKEQPPAVDSEKLFFTSTEPLREDQVQNAVKFLSHPRVRSSPVIHRRSFLEKKGLTKEEIDEAFRRVPDPPSNSGTPEAPNVNQAIQPKSVPTLQPQTPAQAPQPAAAVASGVSTAPSLQQPRFQWSHAFIAAGVLAASGAGTAVFFKTVVVPRLKTWIRKVVAEENETQKEDKSGSVLAEQTAEAAKAAASAAAVVAKASQELLSSKTEERKFFEAFMGMMDVQVKEMKSMGDTIRKLESTREKTYSQDNLREQNIPFSTANGTTNNSWRTPQISQPDATPSSMVPKQVKVNGALNTDSGEVRPSSAPATVESMIAPHSKSYMEILSMIQRGERPPNIKDINDMPPNPNQQLTQPLLAPRPKPWEVAAQQRAGHGHHSQSSGEGMSSKAEENGPSPHENGKSHNASEPWWTKKPVIEHEDVGEPSNLPNYSSNRVSEQPAQRGWVPPQPPSVAVPEAAAAIRQPKSSGVKHQLGSNRSATPSEDGEGGSWRASDAGEAEPESSGGFGATEPKQTEIEEVAVDGVAAAVN